MKKYFQKIKDSLLDNGKAAIQAITIDDNLYDRYKKREDFIQKYIFPGGFLPSKNSLINLSKETNLIFEGEQFIWISLFQYIKFMERRIFEKMGKISSQGFDLTFKRMWNFYLSYCEAGFKSKNIDLIQFSLSNK